MKSEIFLHPICPICVTVHTDLKYNHFNNPNTVSSKYKNIILLSMNCNKINDNLGILSASLSDIICQYE